MNQLLWIGCLESDEEFKIKASKGYDLASAQVSQKNLLLGIEQVSGCICDSINGSVLPPYPIYKDRIIQTVEWSHSNGSFDISVGYNNDKYINRLNCKNALLKAAELWYKERYKGGDLTIFVYSMRSAPMASACRIKKIIPKAKIYLIVTDLPQFMDLGQKKIKAFLKKIDWRSIKKIQSQFDGFILYASKMAEFLQIPNNKWMLMEGIYDNKEIIEPSSLEKKKAIMYSGKLDEQYGIPLFLNAFMQIEDKDLELWLTGGGNAENYIKECVLKDKRIKFYGFLQNRVDVLEKQREAALLVNLRLPSEAASDYCFPSKLLEYMATGIPVLSFKIGGIPEEYYDKLIMIENENIESIKKAIMYSFNLTPEDQDKLGEKAKAFVMKNKSILRQSERIFHWVSRGTSS